MTAALAQRIAETAHAAAYRLIGCEIDGSNHFCLELSNGLGECFVDLNVWTYDDGRGPQVVGWDVLLTQDWTCSAPTRAAAQTWLAANKAELEDAVFGALEARS